MTQVCSVEGLIQPIRAPRGRESTKLADRQPNTSSVDSLAKSRADAIVAAIEEILNEESEAAPKATNVAGAVGVLAHDIFKLLMHCDIPESVEYLLELSTTMMPTAHSFQDLLLTLAEHPNSKCHQRLATILAGAFDDTPMQESFYVVCLNRKNRPLCRNRLTLGTATNVLVHPREVFRIAVLASATAIVCVHNHPSGDPSPSAADLAVTRQLREAAKTMDIHLLDHVIIGTKEDDPTGQGFHSFRSVGLI